MSNEYKDWLNENKQDRDKFLTEAMGECWHVREGDEYKGDPTPYHLCRCGKKLVFHDVSSLYNPNFSTWEGFGKLWEWSKAQDWFNHFWTWKDVCPAIPIQYVHPNDFADAVYEYLVKESEARG